MIKILILIICFSSYGMLKSQEVKDLQIPIEKKINIGEYFYTTVSLGSTYTFHTYLGSRRTADHVWVKKSQDRKGLNELSILISKYDGSIRVEIFEEFIIDTIKNVIYQIGRYDEELSGGNLHKKPTIVFKLPPNKWLWGIGFDGKSSYASATYGSVSLHGKVYKEALIIKQNCGSTFSVFWYYLKGLGLVKQEGHTIDKGVLKKSTMMELELE